MGGEPGHAGAAAFVAEAAPAAGANGAPQCVCLGIAAAATLDKVAPVRVL